MPDAVYLLHSWLQDPINWDYGGSIYSIYQYYAILLLASWTGDIQQLATGSIPKSKVAVSNFFRERPRSKYMIIFRYQSHLCWNCAWVCLKWSTSKNSLVSHHVSHQKLSLYAICKHIQKTNCWVYIHLDAKAKKKTILKHFLKGFLKGTLLAPKWRKSADKSLSQPGCSHSNTIYEVQLQKTIVLRMQPQQEATLTQPFQCDLQPQLQETHRTTHTGATILAKYIEGTKRPQPHPPHTRGTFHRRLQPLYAEKHKVSCSGFLPTTKPMQHSCSHSNAICNHSFKKRIELRTQEQPFLQNT